MTQRPSTARRIFGIETEYGVTAAPTDERPQLSADEVARYLFRKVVAWGRSSNVFLRNGSRLYLDVGSHPEYATAECDSVRQLIAYDRGGETILRELIEDAQLKMAADGYTGRVHLFKNNSDSAGNSFGCHENYLVRRRADFVRLQEILVPFLITRQLLAGAGRLQSTATGARYCLSQRADHIWESVSSATTRSRPIINTRDEPHADAERYRRLHVIVGDSNMAEPTTMFKVGSTDLLLRFVEAGGAWGELSFENPMAAIRDISHDPSGRAPVTLATGRTMTALEVQELYCETIGEAAESWTLSQTDQDVLDLWRRGLAAFRAQDMSSVERELDWVIKRDLLRRYHDKHGLDYSDPRLARLELAYHDLSLETGLYYRLAGRGLVRRICSDAEVELATEYPPPTTRARLRGEFVRRAQDAKRDYTVDWVHLKLNDLTQRTVVCQDPFAAVDERVDKLLEQLEG